MTPEIQTFLLSMTPIGELRISLPVALTIYRLDFGIAYLLSVLGNLVPVVFLLLFLKPVSNWLSENFKFFEKSFSRLFKRTKEKSNSKMEKYGHFALIMFVAIPLPFTGGWTGAIIAFLFGIPFKKSFPLITLGIMIAGLIVFLVTETGITIEKYFGWQILIGLSLIIGLGLIIYNKINQKNSKIKSDNKL